jgi:hypothetical protein
VSERDRPHTYALVLVDDLAETMAQATHGLDVGDLGANELARFARLHGAIDAGPPSPVLAPPELDAEEQLVMDHILEAMDGIQRLGLKTNQNELAAAVHVLQGFVIQHMLQRLAPGHWGAWYREVPDAG